MTVVLLSAGRHPVTGRFRPAQGDARALQLAWVSARPGQRVIGLHAGQDDAALRVYAGFGQVDLIRLDLLADADPLPALAAWLRRHRPALLLTGTTAEHGPATGMVPYALADLLAATCIPDVTAIESVDDRVTLIQALEGGRRRRLATPTPAVLTAAPAAPPPPGWAYARAARATVDVEPATSSSHADKPAWRVEPARPLARPVRKIRGGAAVRMAAATSFTTGRGNLLVSPAPQDAARAIAEYLAAEGLV